jgi:hypothetical protein
MSDPEVKTGSEVMTEEEQKRVNSREHLWRAALWAGFAHGEQIVNALRNNQRPWFNELAPLTTEERVFIMGQVCKYFFPEMTGENETQAFRLLGKLYGAKKNRHVRRMEKQYAN